MVAALPHHRTNGPAVGRRRGDEFYVRSRSPFRLANVDTRQLPACDGQRAAPRGDAHHLRHPLWTATAPLGGRRGVHDCGTSKREKQATPQPDPLPTDQSRHRLQQDVRHARISAGRIAALRAGIFGDPIPHSTRRQAALCELRRRRTEDQQLAGRNEEILWLQRSFRVAGKMGRLGGCGLTGLAATWRESRSNRQQYWRSARATFSRRIREQPSAAGRARAIARSRRTTGCSAQNGIKSD